MGFLIQTSALTSINVNHQRSYMICRLPKFLYFLPNMLRFQARQDISEGKKVSFSSLVNSSLCRVLQSKAWCDRCSHYQLIEQRKFPQTLPNLLTFAFGLDQNVSVLIYASYNSRMKYGEVYCKTFLRSNGLLKTLGFLLSLNILFVPFYMLRLKIAFKNESCEVTENSTDNADYGYQLYVIKIY